ncbi:MAG: glycine C-acetyltransferase [Pseudomonadota bacterium]|jgi:glycine C-acetyltransferase
MHSIYTELQQELDNIKSQGLYKTERIIEGSQGAVISVNGKQVLNFCANNYLGLSGNAEVVQASQKTMDTYGFGLSSVRFICGTQTIHKQLEQKIAQFVGCEDAILYAAAFDANGGVFEPLLGEQDAIISDELNHASIIDGVRLCKAKRYRYTHNDMESLEQQLKLATEEQKARRIVVVSDGVFSMDGTIAQVDKIVSLAKKYNALTMLDESHSTGFVGANGRGTPELTNTLGKIDIITGTFGKALGGASGGFTAARPEIIEMLRQRSRPYLFSNTLAPAVVGATLHVLDTLSNSSELIQKLQNNTAYFRKHMSEAGFNIIKGTHAICPVMLGDAKLAQEMSAKLLELGIYVIGFFYPVVPQGKARIRVQISAGHEQEHLDKAIGAFIKVGQELGVI